MDTAQVAVVAADCVAQQSWLNLVERGFVELYDSAWVSLAGSP
jgi:hypothetical protein